MQDLAIAAASAGNLFDAAVLRDTPQPQASVQGDAHDTSIYDLPSVDDLEVAAAAAAAALEVLAPMKSSSEEDSSSEDSETSEDEDDDDEDSSMGSGALREMHEDDSRDQFTQGVVLNGTPGSASALAGQHSQVRVVLETCSDLVEGVRMTLVLGASEESPLDVENPCCTGGHTEDRAMEEVKAGVATALPLDRMKGLEEEEEGNSSCSSSSRSISSAEPGPGSDDDVESIGYDELRDLITRAYEDPGDDEGASAHCPSAREDLGLPAEVRPITEEVRSDDVIAVAGAITAVLEGMIVVQGPQHAPALEEGSLLCLEDRHVIGYVEEVFGPVMHPLYALRYAGAVPPPSGLAPGARVFSVKRLAKYVVNEQLRNEHQRFVKAEDPEEEEVFFSDDEAELEYTRTMRATKRTVAGEEKKKGGQGGRKEVRGRQANPRHPSQVQVAGMNSPQGNWRQARGKPPGPQPNAGIPPPPPGLPPPSPRRHQHTGPSGPHRMGVPDDGGASFHPHPTPPGGPPHPYCWDPPFPAGMGSNPYGHHQQGLPMGPGPAGPFIPGAHDGPPISQQFPSHFNQGPGQWGVAVQGSMGPYGGERGAHHNAMAFPHQGTPMPPPQWMGQGFFPPSGPGHGPGMNMQMWPRPGPGFNG